MNKWIIIVLVALLVICGGGFALKSVLPWDLIQPSVVPEPVLMLGSFAVSNSMLVTLLVDILLIVITLAATRNLQLVPRGLQNVMEVVVEAVYNLVNTTVGGDEKRVRWFFPFVITILLFLLPANLTDILPLFGPVGVVHYDNPSQQPPKGVTTLFDLPASVFHVPPEAHVPPKTAEVEGGQGTNANPSQAEFVPFFRPPSSDLNVTLALALISVFMTQVYGIAHLGIGGYVSKFIVLGKLRQGFSALFRGNAKEAAALIGFGFLDFIVGILELISEASKIISFTFRLFGNIFAGDVVLLVMAFLGQLFIFPLLPMPFYALEVLVGVIQAFIFAMLTLVFMTGATTAPHTAEEHH